MQATVRKKGISCVIYDEDLSGERLTQAVCKVFADSGEYSNALARLKARDGIREVCALIAKLAAAKATSSVEWFTTSMWPRAEQDFHAF